MDDEQDPATPNPEWDATRIFDQDGSSESLSCDFDLTSPSNQSGDSIALPEQIGDYKLGEMIGEGGMGQVYRAQHVRMERDVAIKVLPSNLMGDQRSIDRFYSEVRAAAKLMHPNIVTALDAGEINSVHYLAMEYVDGVNLATMVASRGPLPTGEAAGIIRQAAMGLLHAHRAGIVHRDVKPGNLMRASDGTIKVLDLGLARIHGPLVQATEQTPSSKRKHLIGTLPYMAPEQLEHADSADPRSDIYSLGATLHYLLTGQTPYTGDYIEQVYGHRHGIIPDLMALCPDADLNFANIFERMMAKSPDERFSSLDEVIEVLGPYAVRSEAPQWLSEFVQRQDSVDTSSFSSATSEVHSDSVLGIEYGMFHAAAAECTPDGETDELSIEGSSSQLFRCVIAADHTGVAVGALAARRRAVHPATVMHSLPLYIGRKVLPRPIGDVECPPEAAIGLLIRRIVDQCWPHEDRPQAVALTTLASYDQLHRKAFEQAASIAGLLSVRLIDRSLACGTALVSGILATETSPVRPSSQSDESLINESSSFDLVAKVQPPLRRNILYVGLSGQGSETAMMRGKDGRLKQLAVGGHWHCGSLQFLHHLTDCAAKQFVAEHKIDPKRSLEEATALQIACEKALYSMAVLPTATITVGRHRIDIRRSDWLDKCGDLIDNLRHWVVQVIKASGRRWAEIDHCLLFGPLLRIPAIRSRVLDGLPKRTEISYVDRDMAARGAAMCVSSQLPGRTGHPAPPRGVTGQTIGLMIEDKKRRRRILPLIPRGTVTPARVNRRVTANPERGTMSITVAESSGIEGQTWQSLGKNEIKIETDAAGSISRTISFEVDINGLLSIRVQGAGGPGSVKLPSLPQPNLTDSQILHWRRWVDGNV